MKQFNTAKKLLLASLIGVASSVNGQTITHPLAFASTDPGVDSPNWYRNYVGVRVEVDAPASIAGDKTSTSAIIGTGTDDWPNIVYTNLYDLPIVMPPASDSFFASGLPAGCMAGKIAVVWRGPMTGTGVYFVTKAYNAQQAGAVAIVLINEYPGAEPITPAYVSGYGTVTIPVYMIGNADGIAIRNQYMADTNSVRMTITNWGHDLTNDLGFVPGGYALWHNYAIPYDQITPINPEAYKGLDGAFIANYGTNAAYNVTLSDSLFFTPDGSSTVQIHAGSENFPGPFNSIDSIYAIFSNTEYNVYSSDIPASTPGRYDLKYNITSDSTDLYPGDNSATYSFYTTDSLYSKGLYNFTANQPFVNSWRGGGADFIWGPMYYVAKGGASVSDIQYSIAENTTTAATPLSGNSNVYIFKWVDGFIDSSSGTPVDYPMDGIVQNGELQLAAIGDYTYGLLPSDTSEGILNLRVNNITDPSGLISPYYLILDSNSWYYFAVDPGSSTTLPLFLGVDNVLNPYPRVYGRYYNNGIMDYSNIQNGFAESAISTYDMYGCLPLAGSLVGTIDSVDSFNYSSMIGLIPSVAVVVNKNPPRLAVNNTVKPFADVNLFPNPAKNELNVSLQLLQVTNSVTYTVIDGLGRFVSKETHNNVMVDNFAINTTDYPPGNYYLIINITGKVMSEKFTIVK